jgi:FkbM family methyltransferase
MSISLALRQYYSLFGIRGVTLAAKSRTLKKSIHVKTTPKGFLHPLYLRLRSSDVTLFRSIFLDLEYDWPIAKCPSVIVDAGANVGFTSVFFARRYPQARIIAVEPDSSNFAILTRNTEPYANITAIRAALWKESKRLAIVDPGLGYWAFRASDNEEDAAGEKSRGAVEGVTLDRVLADRGLNHIDILKVDIEGAEKELFESSGTWIDRVGAIVVEIHDYTGCREAVYAATKNFAIEEHQGDTTIFMRQNYALPKPVVARYLEERHQNRLHLNSLLPFDIAEIS